MLSVRTRRAFDREHRAGRWRKRRGHSHAVRHDRHSVRYVLAVGGQRDRRSLQFPSQCTGVHDFEHAPPVAGKAKRLTNHVNLRPPTGQAANMGAPAFLQRTAARDARQIQWGVRYVF